MPALESMDCNDWAYYWAKVPADRTGNFRRAANPVVIQVRWVENDKIVMDAKGNTVTSPVQLVFLQNVLLGSILRFGGRRSNPPAQQGLFYEVVGFSTGEDLKGNPANTRREGNLMVIGTTLPP